MTTMLIYKCQYHFFDYKSVHYQNWVNLELDAELQLFSCQLIMSVLSKLQAEWVNLLYMLMDIKYKNIFV